MRKLSRTGSRYGQPVFVVAFVNFSVFWVVAARIGGDAVSGRVEGGRYYLSDHGVRTQVSRSVYNYSLVHTVSTWATHGVALGGAVVLYVLGKLYEPQPGGQAPGLARHAEPGAAADTHPGGGSAEF